MKYAAGLILCQGALAAAFVVPQGNNHVLSNQKGGLLKKGSVLFSTPEEDKIDATSFADAGKNIIDAEDDKRMEAMGDFDENPGALQDSQLEAIREAVRKRAEEVGAKKDTASQQYIEAATQRAIDNRNNAQQPGQLDLSQITTGNEPGTKKSKFDESLPTMMYDPADDMTEAEQAEADPLGQQPIWEQAIEEIKASKWPDFGTVVREVSIMAVVVAVTGALIINWDVLLRDTYTGLGLIPRPEDIPGQLSDLDLPAGFTNNMNENDLAQITNEMNQAGKEAGLSSQALDMQNSNPDL